MKNILVPTDFSSAAHNAFEYALELAGALDGNITLLHVYPEDPVIRDWEVPPVIDLLNADRVEEALARFRLYATEAREKLGKQIPLEIELEAGRPEREIVRRCEGGNIDLIVMGTLGETGAKEKVFGSVTVDVIELAGCPVLAVPIEAKYNPIKHITYATTFQEKDFEYIEQLLTLADKVGATISCTKVKPFEGSWDKLEFGFLEQLIRYKGKWHMLEFFTMSESDIVKGLEVFVQERNVDMIAMLTHHRDLLGRLFNPGFTRKMAYATRIPLLVFHE
jgi:nucleotide-binding universal stress UspA family protein